MLGGEGMERFVGQEENFVSDAWSNWEPLRVDQSGGDVLPGFGAGEDLGCRVLHKHWKKGNIGSWIYKSEVSKSNIIYILFVNMV